MIYYVTKSGMDTNDGSREHPFLTINRAAQIALAGDTVRVGEGVYREWVNPKNSGLSEDMRIVYEAIEGEKPVIKGSDVVSDWTQVEGSVYKTVIDNSLFGDYNPYELTLDGDWMIYPDKYRMHRGEVFVDGVSMFEAPSYEEMKRGEIFDIFNRDEDSNKDLVMDERIPFPERTRYRWYAEVKDGVTTIWCNFGDKIPSEHLVEISVREACFYPTRTGINYITLRGFEIADAACPYIPPTTDQVGMVGVNWSRGWIIENNHLYNAKCSAISIGKEGSTGDNNHFKYRLKSGYISQMEAVFLAEQAGWSKEKIGSHIIRNNIIHDCGQNGIVGHLGSAFSRIENNHIYHIGMKQEFYGCEIAGIKLHAALDTVIENNFVHDCLLGMWLDWQAQGIHVKGCVFARNYKDMMVEVSHGPLLVENNVFLSDVFMVLAAQGTAFVHNLIAGSIYRLDVLNRFTPYHLPHSTKVLGLYASLGGDDRVYNNLFLASKPLKTDNLQYMGSMYDIFNTEEQYYEIIKSKPVGDDTSKFWETRQPVWIDGNAYAGYSKPFHLEKHYVRADGIGANLDEQDGKWTVTLDVPEALIGFECQGYSSENLGRVRHPMQRFENADGSSIYINKDILGVDREGKYIPGPFASLKAGKNTFTVWG